MYKRLFGSLFNRGGRRGGGADASSGPSVPPDPLAAAMLSRKQRSRLGAAGAGAAQAPTAGGLAGSSLFGEDTGPAPPSSGSDEHVSAEQRARRARRAQLDPQLSAAALDPRPAARKRWVAKMVRQSVVRQGAISKATVLRRTEREHLGRSAWLQTSIKKLVPLARQIQGLPVDDALAQLRFSRKLVAADVARHLRAVRDEAVAAKGMGLEHPEVDPVEVRDYHGRRRLVKDPAALYVHRAFVGRGPYGKVPEIRARGRMNILRPPYTSISIELKEEKTRMRIAREREDREQRRKPWVPHPDRPITQQQQYLMW